MPCFNSKEIMSRSCDRFNVFAAEGQEHIIFKENKAMKRWILHEFICIL